MFVAAQLVQRPGRLVHSNVCARPVLAIAVVFGSATAYAQAPAQDGGFGSNASAAEASAAEVRDETPPTGKITMGNWRQYREYMPDGMAMLFEGKYFWKMLSDIQMDIGPTVIHSLPKNYLDAAERYSGQVKLVDLPDGALTLPGYQGGIPFPNPAEPHAGWKNIAGSQAVERLKAFDNLLGFRWYPMCDKSRQGEMTRWQSV